MELGSRGAAALARRRDRAGRPERDVSLTPPPESDSRDNGDEHEVVAASNA
jgi:hypothetical protein